MSTAPADLPVTTMTRAEHDVTFGAGAEPAPFITSMHRSADGSWPLARLVVTDD